MPRRWRRRQGSRGRPPKPVLIERIPKERRYTPDPSGELEPVQLGPAELEVLRLVDLEELSQEEAGERMGVSRGTVWRILQEARRKAAAALAEGRPIIISGSSTGEETNL